MITDAVQSLYQSQRLRYIKADENDENYIAFQTQIQNDPAVHALVTDKVIRPQGSQNAKDRCSEFNNALLGVAICLLPEGGTEEKAPVIIGQLAIGWGGISPETAVNRTASLGITIAPEYHGKGFGPEAINWGLDWAFRHAGLHSVSICAASFNTKAAELYARLGFVFEGRLRHRAWFNREWHDELWFSMLEDEWEALRGTNSKSNNSK